MHQLGNGERVRLKRFALGVISKFRSIMSALGLLLNLLP